MSKISIALCTYNGARFLSEQLESFARQTRLPDELIVGDDCSSDKTVSILEDFARRAAFPVSIRANEKNLRSTRNFEQTILRCAGDIVFLSDQDDVWLPEKIARVAAEFERDEAVGLVFTDADLVDENLNFLGKKLWDYSFSPPMRELAREKGILPVLFHQSTVTGATAAFRRQFADSFVPIPTDVPRVIHDEWIALTVALQSKTIFLEESLIKYRQHSGQQLGVIEKDEQTAPGLYGAKLRWLAKREEKLRALKESFARNPKWRDATMKAKINSFIEPELNEIRRHLEHIEFRRNLPAPRLKRASAIFGELRTKRYAEFSKGFLSAAKDLFRD